MIAASRRNFLTSFGALVATASLPSIADDPTLFPKRGDFERLSLAYHHIHLGLKQPFSILHISDTHLSAAYPNEDEKKLKLSRIRTPNFGGCQEAALADSLAWAKKNADYVLHTGDLIDWQTRANYDLVKKYFGDSGMFGCVGNHEYWRNMWLERQESSEAYKALSRHELAQVYPFDLELQSKIVNGVNFVTIDDVYGYVTARQVARFKNEVKKGLPIILCMHVPFYSPEIWRAFGKFWHADGRFTTAALPKAAGDYRVQQRDVVTRDFIAYLKREPLLRGILAGHLHFTFEERFSPTAMQYLVAGNFLFAGAEVLFT